MCHSCPSSDYLGFAQMFLPLVMSWRKRDESSPPTVVQVSGQGLQSCGEEVGWPKVWDAG